MFGNRTTATGVSARSAGDSGLFGSLTAAMRQLSDMTIGPVSSLQSLSRAIREWQQEILKNEQAVRNGTMTRANADKANAALRQNIQTNERQSLAIQASSNALNGFATRSQATFQAIANVGNQAFSSLRSAIFSIEIGVASFVKMANPAAFLMFQRAVEDLYATIGRILTPVLLNVTAVIQKMADHLAASGPGAKVLVAVLGAMTVVVGGLIGALGGAVIAINLVSFALSVATGGISAIANAVGAIVGAAVGAGTAAGTLAIAFGVIATPIEKLRQLMDSLMPAISAVAEVIGNALVGVLTILTPIVRIIALSFASFTESFINGMKIVYEVFDRMVPILSKIGQAALYFVAGLELIADAMQSQVAGKAPPKAPPAVRQVTSGTIAASITKQQTMALQGVSDNPQLTAINGLTKAINQAKSDLLKAKDDIVSAIVNIATAPVRGAAEIATSGVASMFTRIAVLGK